MRSKNLQNVKNSKNIITIIFRSQKYSQGREQLHLIVQTPGVIPNTAHQTRAPALELMSPLAPSAPRPSPGTSGTWTLRPPWRREGEVGLDLIQADLPTRLCQKTIPGAPLCLGGSSGTNSLLLCLPMPSEKRFPEKRNLSEKAPQAG